MTNGAHLVYVQETNVSTGKKRPVNQAVEPSQRPERLGVRLPAGMTERIKTVAASDRRTVTSWVEKLIADALEQAERKN